MAVPSMCYVQLNCSIGGVVRQWVYLGFIMALNKQKLCTDAVHAKNCGFSDSGQAALLTSRLNR